MAASKNMEAVVNTLIEKAPELVKAQSVDGLTPLHLACMGGYLSACKKLVAAGAEITVPDTKARMEVVELCHVVEWCHAVWMVSIRSRAIPSAFLPLYDGSIVSHTCTALVAAYRQ
jgi:hypothetical protein